VAGGAMKMPVEVVSGQGTLRREGGGYERQCKLEIAREPVMVDEEATPLRYLYKRVLVVDSDNFPEGIYILSFNGQNQRLRRTKDGHYLGV
jgi:hypothetical protein